MQWLLIILFTFAWSWYFFPSPPIDYTVPEIPYESKYMLGSTVDETEELKKIKQVCVDNNLKYHLDGARLWNAIVEKKQHPKQFGELFDTISVCFSKGLGAPIGSVLISDAETMHKALRIRKIFGGNLRQSGYLAAAGIYALQNNINRLTDDHRRAKELGQALQQLPWVDKVAPVETNILIFEVKKTLSEKEVIEKLKTKGILISSMGQGKLRMVTHLDYRQVMHEYVLEALGKILFN
jgi:threonine aldolase